MYVLLIANGKFGEIGDKPYLQLNSEVEGHMVAYTYMLKKSNYI